MKIMKMNMIIFLNENERKIDQISDKVSSLKNVSSNLKTQFNNQNIVLDDLEENFEGADEKLDANVTKLESVAEISSCRLMFYVACFIFAVFLVIYFLIDWTTKPNQN
ncbi:golgi snare bet1-related [Anaeramoeba ignava]|uniref:Golgi snare bet1-related n=1 Tax=Anaeramoeba ignava TaxID=1746090 RepID=A0A9Q0LM44_ANAIG|nr:golgi snare bet1-related [Anaeramoeba ignava]